MREHKPFGKRQENCKKLLSDKIDANLGYLYENVAVQILASKGRKLYYHTWLKENSSHYFEVDFLIAENNKVIPIEVKSSSARNHSSIDEFEKKYSKCVGKRYLFSQKDLGKNGTLLLRPVYMLQFMFE